MEKLIYLLFSANNEPEDQFAATMKAAAKRLASAAGVRGMTLYLADAEVEPARFRRIQTSANLPLAMVSVWFDNWMQSAALESTLTDLCEYHAYLVTESEPLVMASQTPGRVPGMCHIAMFQRPPRLQHAEWLEIWQGHHTQVAIDTQSTFGYRQNVVVRPLSSGAPPYSGIVEENFPADAMTSQYTFFACENDEGLRANMEAMMTSCQEFLDFDKIDVVPVSQYIIRERASASAHQSADN